MISAAKPKHFLTGNELSPGDLLNLLTLAETLRAERDAGVARSDLKGKSIALLFEKPSLRTHLSFSLAMKELGGETVESFSLNRKQEEPEDVGRVVEGYCDAIMLRTHEHSILERMAAITEVPIINGLSDDHHPCQILADLLTLRQKFGKLEGLTVAYIGDGNNMLHSMLLLAPSLGVNVHYACPKGYEPSALVLKNARAVSRESKARIQGFPTPAEAAVGADALYTDVWTSMGFEEEAERREAAFRGYQINAELLARAKPHCLVMHCLPMVRGKEIAADLVDHPDSVIFRQSENRLHAQKALLLTLLGSQALPGSLR